MRQKITSSLLAAALFAALGATVFAAKKTSLTLDQVPAPVRDTLLSQAPAESIQSLRQRVHHDYPTYSAKVSNEGKTYEITIAEDGIVLHKELIDEETPAPTLHQEDIPSPARDMIAKTIPEAAVKEIHSVYTLCVTAGGKVYTVRIRYDGTVLTRELDEEKTQALNAPAAK